MERKNIFLFIFFIIVALFFASCKPINIFSPLINPSKMGNDAKLDAGYNAIASGDYDEAIDYFSDVIDSASGDQLVEAYLGRGAAYMYKASSNIDSVTEDLLDGDLEADDQGAIISRAVEDGDYVTFFANIDNAADDFNAAIDNTTGEYDSGVLFEAYQTNMMAATGIGAQKIATVYPTAPWRVPADVTMNEALDAIVNDEPTHDGRIETWESTGSPNGLTTYVQPDPTTTDSMMNYLRDAYEALNQMKNNPPAGMSEQDITDMQQGINDWVTNGLGEAALI